MPVSHEILRLEYLASSAGSVLRRRQKTRSARLDCNPAGEVFSCEYLESIYKDVTGDFKHEPKVKTYIEVFPTHDAFSVRTSGSPWIGTVGASTGRVIAMVAPRRGILTMGPFNWSQVLRHEFTHTVTLSATDNRIAHWMTEGLAVLEEQSPLQWGWVPMLNDAGEGEGKKAFTIEDLTWAFVRPRKPSDRQLAYAESFLDLHVRRQDLRPAEDPRHAGTIPPRPKPGGDVSVGARQEHRGVPDRVLRVVDQQVASWGYDAETSAKVKDLTKKGESLIKANQWPRHCRCGKRSTSSARWNELPHMRCRRSISSSSARTTR